MQRHKANKLWRESFVVIFIPMLLIATLQVTATHLYYSWFVLAASGVGIFCWCLYRFFYKLEELAWQEQLNCVLQNVTVPVLIADMRHQIAYINDSFCHLPVAKLLGRFNNLVELLVSQENSADIVEKMHKMTQRKTMLDELSAKATVILSQELSFEWVMVPLCSTSGKRWGTLVECRPYKQSETPLLK